MTSKGKSFGASLSGGERAKEDSEEEEVKQMFNNRDRIKRQTRKPFRHSGSYHSRNSMDKGNKLVSTTQITVTETKVISKFGIAKRKERVETTTERFKL